MIVCHGIELHGFFQDVQLSEERQIWIEFSSDYLYVLIESRISEHFELMLDVHLLNAHLKSSVLFFLLFLKLQ